MPPIQRGQLLKDIDLGYNVVAIVDGKFDQNLAVTPSEVMDALRAGVRIYGASSMGALRAAECENYGAIGCGKIFEFIKKSENFRDDFLGQLFIDQKTFDQTFQWKNKTYVDFYFAAADLAAKKKISKKHAEKIREIYQQIFYAERGLDSLLQLVHKQKKDAAELTQVAQLIFAEKITQKSRDAMELLHLIKKDLEKIQKANAQILAEAQKAPNPLNFYPRDLY